MAAQHTRSDELERVITARIKQRNDLLAELSNMLQAHGGSPDARHGDWKGTLHREWTWLAHTLDGDKPNALVEELRRADRMLIARYDSVIARLGDEPVAHTLVRQRADLNRSRMELGGFV